MLLGQAVAACGPAANVDVTAAGHAHIDVAWLWPVAQTRRKAGQDVSQRAAPDGRVLRLPLHPEPAAAVRLRAQRLPRPLRVDQEAGRRGSLGADRWHVGRSRLQHHRRRSARTPIRARTHVLPEQFGLDSPVLWLPDVFGYAWQLPQLIKSAGLEFFFTTKISWNLYNRLPYDSFWWQGLDGTRVLTHFSPTPSTDDVHWNTYNALAWPADVFGTWKNYLHSDAAPAGETAPVLMSYGWGDGGGGPTREMVENLAVMADFPGTPRVGRGRAVDFFEELDRRCGTYLPTWNGELYLEYHQGTYTTHGDVKRANRRCEIALHDAELLASWATVVAGADYPAERLGEAWKLLCLNQFHDILPGSSIAEVYVDAAKDHARGSLRSPPRSSTMRWTRCPPSGTPTPATCRSIPRHSVAGGAPRSPPQRRAGRPTSTSAPAPNWPNRRSMVERLSRSKWMGSVSSKSVNAGPRHLRREPDQRVPTHQERPSAPVASGRALPTTASCWRTRSYVSNCPRTERSRGYSTRSIDREVVGPGRPGNVFQAFEDRPIEFDAWNIDLFINDRQWSAEPGEQRHHRRGWAAACVDRVSRRLGASTIVQRVQLCRR